MILDAGRHHQAKGKGGDATDLPVPDAGLLVQVRLELGRLLEPRILVLEIFVLKRMLFPLPQIFLEGVFHLVDDLLKLLLFRGMM